MQLTTTLAKGLILLGLTLSGSQLLAETKTSAMADDATVKMSDRQAVLALSILGLGSRDFSFPVYFKPLNGYKQRIGEWSVRISQSYADEMLETQYPMLISNRFDKIVFGPKHASIYTATKDITKAYAGAPRFDFEPGSFEIFKKEVETYLNKEIASQVIKVLDAAKDARYSEMNQDDAASFIQSKAKESGIPAEILEKLVSSSYVFAAYLPRLEGSLEIAHVEKTNFITGHKSRVFESTFYAPLHTKMLVYKFDGKQFTLKSTIDSESNGDLFGSAAKFISGSATISRPFRPQRGDAQRLFDEVFSVSLKDSLIAIGTRLKEDRAFAVSAPLDEVDGSQVVFNMGIQEDIRVDHPFDIYRTIDGKEELMGTIKVKTPGLNCALSKQEARTKSRGALISGSAEAFDLAVEHPWTGVYGSLFYEQTEGNFLFDGVDTGSGASQMLNFGFNADLGYVLNSHMMREMWMNLDIGFGIATYGAGMPDVIDTITYSPVDGSAFGARAAFGLEKRFNLFSNTFVAIGADIGYDAQFYNYELGQSLTLTTVEAIPRVKVGINMGINKELTLAAGYNIPIVVGATFGDSESSGSVAGFERDAGLDIRVGFSYHVDFAGPFTKMMSTPSKTCDALKQ